MAEEDALVAEELQLDGVAQTLRRAREQSGLELSQIAAETRIPVRHLEVIERGAFEELPSRTYAIGFSRTYAQVVGLDPHDIAQQVRDELAENANERVDRREAFEPGDPAKVPSVALAWVGGLAALALFIAGVTVYTGQFGAGIDPAPLVPGPEATLAQQSPSVDGAGSDGQAASAPGEGQVVFRALEDGVWVRFYDAAGQRLLEKQMAIGERFEIPSDAQGPQIWTGRPDAFAITIDGRPVPKLAEEDSVIRDVAISAEALLARNGNGLIPQIN